MAVVPRQAIIILVYNLLRLSESTAAEDINGTKNAIKPSTMFANKIQFASVSVKDSFGCLIAWHDNSFTVCVSFKKMRVRVDAEIQSIFIVSFFSNKKTVQSIMCVCVDVGTKKKK